MSVDAHPAMPEPACCGYPLDALGHQDAFRLHATRVAASLSGFEAVVVEGPACAHTLMARYRAVGVRPSFKVLPLVDVLARHLPPGSNSSSKTEIHQPPNASSASISGWVRGGAAGGRVERKGGSRARRRHA